MAGVSHCGVVSAAPALGAERTAAAGFVVSIALWMLMFAPICGVGSFFIEASRDKRRRHSASSQTGGW
jgi:Na+-driven multidrug efflux pump